MVRTRHWAAVLLLIATGLLAACNDGEDGGDSTETESPTTSASASAEATATDTATGAATEAATETAAGEADADAFPVTIEHKYGSTTIEAAPERVVSVGFQDHDFLLALGVKPVGVREWWGEKPYATWTWAEEALGDAQPTVIPSGELDIEQVASLEPDLIVGFYSGITDAEYELLSGIAPTVTQPDTYVDYGMPWEEQLLETGRAVGRSAEAQAILDETLAKFEEIRAAHPEFEGKTALIGGPGEGGAFWAYGPEDPRSRLLTSLGFVYPEAVADVATDAFYVDISAEQGALLESDVFVQILNSGVTPEDLPANPVWDQLAMVQEGRVYTTSFDADVIGAFSFSSPLSLPWGLERLADELAPLVQ